MTMDYGQKAVVLNIPRVFSGCLESSIHTDDRNLGLGW